MSLEWNGLLPHKFGVPQLAERKFSAKRSPILRLVCPMSNKALREHKMQEIMKDNVHLKFYFHGNTVCGPGWMKEMRYGGRC